MLGRVLGAWGSMKKVKLWLVCWIHSDQVCGDKTPVEEQGVLDWLAHAHRVRGALDDYGQRKAEARILNGSGGR